MEDKLIKELKDFYQKHGKIMPMDKEEAKILMEYIRKLEVNNVTR